MSIGIMVISNIPLFNPCLRMRIVNCSGIIDISLGY